MGDYSDYMEASKLTLGDLLNRYKAENKHKRKKDWKNKEYKIKYILADTISDTNCLKLSTKHLSEFKERRLMLVSSSNFNKDLSFISKSGFSGNLDDLYLAGITVIKSFFILCSAYLYLI